MNIKVTARNLEINDDLRDYAEDKVLRLKKYLDRIQTTEVIFTLESDTTHIELIITAVKGSTFVAEARDTSATASVDICIDKMEKQLKKFNEKLKGKQRKDSGRQRAIKEAGGLPMPAEEAEPSYQEIVDETAGTDPRNAPPEE
ncbi:MAG: ribosome-associated translation inhibitor RaiA [Planctomycetota bacterium]